MLTKLFESWLLKRQKGSCLLSQIFIFCFLLILLFVNVNLTPKSSGFYIKNIFRFLASTLYHVGFLLLPDFRSKKFLDFSFCTTLFFSFFFLLVICCYYYYYYYGYCFVNTLFFLFLTLFFISWVMTPLIEIKKLWSIDLGNYFFDLLIYFIV